VLKVLIVVCERDGRVLALCFPSGNDCGFPTSNSMRGSQSPLTLRNGAEVVIEGSIFLHQVHECLTSLIDLLLLLALIARALRIAGGNTFSAAAAPAARVAAVRKLRRLIALIFLLDSPSAGRR